MTSYPDTLQRGDMISCYQIEEVLGRGGFAVTYLAKDLNLDVHVAIKEYLPREIIHRDEQLNVSARRPEFVEDYSIGLSNFAREAKTLARFKHLNIVRVHQVIHKYNTAYMVMDYEHGQELAEVLDASEALTEDALRDILFPILDGVEEIHRHGLAHRDIKPSNIYLRDNGSPVLLDFGAARYTMSETTQQLTAVVTVGYTPIEQYNVSDNDQGPWSDIYALAAVLYEAVTGEMPVDSVTRASSTLTTASDPLTPVANKARQHYSEDFLRAIDWGLYMEAEDRPQSIAQWRDAFNGSFNPASAYAPGRPAGRPSKLKTRAKYPLQTEAENQHPGAVDDQYQPDHINQHPEQYTEQYPQPQTDPYTHPVSETDEPHISMDVSNNRFDSRFDTDIDDVEIIPLNPSHNSTIASGSGDFEANAADEQSEPSVARIEPPRIKSNTPFSRDQTPRATGAPRTKLAQRSTLTPPRASQPPLQPPRATQPPATSLPPPRATQPPPRATQIPRATQPRATAASPFASNPAAPLAAPEAGTQGTAGAEAVSAELSNNQPEFSNDAAAQVEPLQNISPETGQTTHTQEIRNVLRRDIMKRDPVEHAAPGSALPTHDATDNIANINAPQAHRPGNASAYPTDTDQAQMPLAAREAMRRTSGGRSEIEFDDSDWDYEAPTPPSKWRWLLPTTGLLAVVAGSLVFVNKPELFNFSPAVPEMTVATALEKAQQQMDSDALIFPAGLSALDYYQLILSSDPANAQARDGIRQIQTEIKRQIIVNIDSDNLAEANRLLSRANSAGLQIEGLSDSTAASSEQRSRGDESPWLSGKLAEINTLINERNFTAAEDLFNETDKYIADAGLSQSIRERINAAKNSTANPPLADAIAEAVSVEPQPTAGNNEVIPVIPEVQPPVQQIDRTQQASGSPLTTTTVAEPEIFIEAPVQQQSGATSATQTRPSVTIAEESLPSAPRQSYIEGNGATTQHLNQLRTAIEQKNLRGVLQISDSLPEERTEFLRKMFQRYDRLDVTIDDINNSSGTVTARLSVAMFNQRSDGSYYSAGKWNGVTLSTRQQSGTWQKIKW